MSYHTRHRKQPSLIQYLLLFPIVGLLDLKYDLKEETVHVFTVRWMFYLIFTTMWCCMAGIIIYEINEAYNHRDTILLPGAIILGIVFLLVGIPRIIYKCANRKPRK